MKLKTALKLSLIVNAIFMMAVGYMLATDVKLEAGPLFIYTTTTAETPGSVAMIPQ